MLPEKGEPDSQGALLYSQINVYGCGDAHECVRGDVHEYGRVDAHEYGRVDAHEYGRG
ncbi:MAG TPA: hypothetical protein GX523_14385, partial [Desulfitobacterium dehalogenans]|nr:hypothetical protein [Desulfitobacterium dehalogenans]